MTIKTKYIHNDIRQSNLSIILRIIREKSPISRAELAKITKLTRSTVSSLVDELISLCYIEEIGHSHTNSVGKKPTLLSIRTDKLFSLAVNFSGNEITVAKVDLNGNCSNINKKTMDDPPFELLVEELIEMINNALVDIKKNEQVNAGIGVAFPGPVHKGEILFPAAFKSLEGCNLADILYENFNCQIYIANNADSAALAESWFGKYYNVRSLVFILIDQGIGCGIVIDNNLYYGNNKLTNEFGHIIINANSTSCFCGNNGCLASLASDRAVLRFAPKELLQKLSLTTDSDPAANDVLKIIEYLNDDPNVLSDVISEVSNYLGIGVANLIDMFVPDVILLEGSLLNIPVLIDKVNQAAAKYVHPIFKNSFRIRKSQLGQNAPLIGAGAFLLKDLYFNPLKTMDRNIENKQSANKIINNN